MKPALNCILLFTISDKCQDAPVGPVLPCGPTIPCGPSGPVGPIAPSVRNHNETVIELPPSPAKHFMLMKSPASKFMFMALS